MKNKTILPLFIFCLLSANLIAQNFWVPDAGFRYALKTRFPSCFTTQDSLITNCISSQTTLNVDGESITNLDGIQFFTSLQTLSCSFNFINFISYLPSTLIELSCNKSELTGISNLPPLLENLSCNENYLVSLPSLPANLRALDCQVNSLTSLPALPSALIYLNVGGNNLTNLPSLAAPLKTLNCSYNKLSSLPTLPDSLIYLNCVDNLLTYLPTLPNILNILFCANNKLLVLPALPGSLQHLGCARNPLSILPLLSSSLRTLSCDFIPLNTLPSLPNSLLTLSCCVCNLSNLPVLPNSLKQLSIIGNNICILPSLPDSLTSLYCGSNPISCLPILPANLSIFDCANTYVSCLANIPLGISSTNTLPLCTSGLSPCYYSYTYGFVFNDHNGNGLKDSGELNLPIAISFLNYQFSTANANGYLTIVSDTGNITLNIEIPDYFISTTPLSQTINVSSNSSDTIYFGLQPIPNIKDLKIDLVSYNAFRPGFKANYKIHYQNAGTTSISAATIKFLKPLLLTNISSSPTATSVSGDTLFWTIPNLSPFQEGYITILDSVWSTAPLSAPIVADAWIEPIGQDTTPQDNYRRCHQIIRGSCDPNDKSVSPEIEAPAQSDFIEYVIRFQNTGTDTAFSVLVTDTLSANLDAATIELVSSSHSATFWVEHGIAKWYFANILLPDSNVNEAASHGFVKFKIKQMPNLIMFSQISNTANIYFDYNTAVVTNTVILTVTPVGVNAIHANEKMQLYPNPVHQTVQLKSSNAKPLGRIELFNSDGKLIDSKTISSATFDWQVESLPDGVYLFKGENWQEKIVKQ